MCGVLAALSLAHSKSPLNNAPESEIRTGSGAHGLHTARLARDAGHPDGVREAAEEEEEREGQREDQE